jgi:catechol 2,3-dioxygenase-like lactoylglutathione lyase family enzyme
MVSMSSEADQGGEAPCLAHLIDELDPPTSPPTVLTSNTIIYCEHWSDVVDFYRNGLGLRATMERDWFIEFELHPGAHLSIADARRATITAGDGSGLTLSWRVDDIDAARTRLIARHIEVSTIRTRWGARFIDVFDPAGNRIEFWADG